MKTTGMELIPWAELELSTRLGLTGMLLLVIGAGIMFSGMIIYDMAYYSDRDYVLANLVGGIGVAISLTGVLVAFCGIVLL